MVTDDNLFPIGVLAKSTGVNPITLRAWERRYGLLKPHRTPKGHRLYDKNDIETVNHILAFIKQGIAVGKVKTLLTVQTGVPSDLSKNQSLPWAASLETMIRAGQSFDLHKLEGLYNEMISLYPIEVVSSHLFIPLLKSYQDRLTTNDAIVHAEEHFVTTYIYNRLAAHFQQLASIVKGPLLVFTTLPKSGVELLLLLFAIHCLNAGFRIVSLGANTTLAQTRYAAKNVAANGIVCFGHLGKEERTASQTKATCPIFILNSDKTVSTPFIHLDGNFSAALATIKEVLNN